MEDLDTPRCVPGAADAILRTLERHALLWDGPVTYQSERSDLYRAAVERLVADEHAFACTCSRSRLADATVYPGTCRRRIVSPTEPHALRVEVPAETIVLSDEIQGRFEQRLDAAVGDFVIVRRDGIVAYQLAVVVDDAAQAITKVVRGADLLDNTPRQLLLFRWLAVKPPRYAHVPVLSDRTGHKLSKQLGASSIEARPAGTNLNVLLGLLGHEPPPELARASPQEILVWAVANWDIGRLPRGTVHPGFVCI